MKPLHIRVFIPEFGLESKAPEMVRILATEPNDGLPYLKVLLDPADEDIRWHGIDADGGFVPRSAIRSYPTEDELEESISLRQHYTARADRRPASQRRANRDWRYRS